MFTYDGSFAMCVTGAPGTTQTPSASVRRTHARTDNTMFHCVASYEPSLTD
jgi:hypothetical protein